MNKISNRLCLLALFVVSLLSIQIISPPIAEGQTAKRKTSKSSNKSKPRKRTFIEVASVPTPIETVDEMLRLANIKKGDVLYDLGSGDGRIPLEAARKYGIRAIGVEIKPKLVEEANQRAKAEGISNLAKFLQADLFRMSYRDATIVTLYLSDELNLRLLPTLLRDLRPGARIISHDFRMGDWKPDISTKVPWKNLYRNVHVWIVPKDKNIEHLMSNSVKAEPKLPSLELDKTTAVLPFPFPYPSTNGLSCANQTTIKVEFKNLPTENNFKYKYEVSGGKIIGEGANVTWEVLGIRPGTYEITGIAEDEKGSQSKFTKTITVTECGTCGGLCECPRLSINASAESVKENESITFDAKVDGGSQPDVTYQWRVSNGQIIAGQGTPTIKVSTKGLAGKDVEATLEIGDICPACPMTVTKSVKVISKNLYPSNQVQPPQNKSNNFFITKAVSLTAEPEPPILELDKTEAVLDCPNFFGNAATSCDNQATIGVTLKDFSGADNLKYKYEVSGGKIVGSGKNMIWELAEMKPGHYKIKGIVISPSGNRETLQQEVLVTECSCHPVCYCPKLSVNASAEFVKENEAVTFEAKVVGGSQSNVTYQWKLSNGQIISGQGTSTIKVDTKGIGGKEIEAMIEVAGDMCVDCPRTAVESVKVTLR